MFGMLNITGNHLYVVMFVDCFRYQLNEEDDKLGSGIACIVRACPERVTSLKKEQLLCTSVDWRVNRYPVDENEELVSTMICLRPTDGVDMELEVPDDKSDFNYVRIMIAQYTDNRVCVDGLHSLYTYHGS